MAKLQANIRQRAQRLGQRNPHIWRVDKGPGKRLSVVERREQMAAEAFVNGRRWYAIRLLEFQDFPDNRASCRALILNSRQLIEESRRLIRKTTNTLAFCRKSQKLVN